MKKNILKKYFLTDIFDEEEELVDCFISKIDTTINNVEDLEENIENSDSEDENYQEIDSEDDDSPKIEFIVEEDENKEKQIRLNFEFKVNDLNEKIKIDLEISKNTYLEIADELLK
tara:strand:+ start:125 stop:472 length:348 start_codon:yes stop_codon:yes gene_type:complete